MSSSAPAPPESAAPGGGHHHHHHHHHGPELRRAIDLVGNIAITLSNITPASSVFIIIPVLLATVGSGTFLALVIAAVIGAGMGLCWAELGSTYTTAGGDYTIVRKVLGRAAGFVTLVLNGPVVAILIPAVIALGMSQYLGVIFSSNPQVMAAIVLLISTGIAVLGIRLNAVVTGVFLAAELIALIVVAVLGLVHVQQPVSELFSPHIFDTARGTALPIGTLLGGIAVAIFAYNGYASAMNFSEETEGPRNGIAKAILAALVVAVVAELVPTTLALLGAPSLQSFTNAASPMQYLMTALGGSTLNTIVSLAIAGAIFNAVIAILLQMGRILYSSGRDNAWPRPVSRALGSLHPTLHTPWLATIVAGVVGAVLVLTTDVNTLSTWTGVTLAINYGLIALAAIVSRVRDPHVERPYRMPLWPVAPLVGLVGCSVALYEQAWSDLRVGLGVVAISLIYYVLYLYPRRNSHWVPPVDPAENRIVPAETRA